MVTQITNGSVEKQVGLTGLEDERDGGIGKRSEITGKVLIDYADYMLGCGRAGRVDWLG